MNRLPCLAALIAAAFLFLLPCGWGAEPNGQGTQTHTNEFMAITDLKVANTNAGGYPTTLTLSAGGLPANASSTGKVRVASTLVNGMYYDGEWSAGAANGEGTITDGGGTMQYGEWRDGKPYRVTGRCVFSDGTIEIGVWDHDGSICGGKIIWKDGRQYEGEWKLSEDAPELPDGHGEMTWPDARKYIGRFENGLMDGAGKMTYPDGKVQAGRWNQGKFVGPAQ